MRRSIGVLLAVLALAAAGCASGDDESRIAAASSTSGPSATGNGSDITATAPTEPIAPSGLNLPSEITGPAHFEHALSSLPCEELAGWPTTTIAGPREPQSVHAEGANGLCYEVSGDELSVHPVVAEAVADAGSWGVRLTFADADKAAANEFFDACYEGTDACPMFEGGRGAYLVFAGPVVLAPQVDKLGYANEPEVIGSGQLDQAQAEALATAINTP